MADDDDLWAALEGGTPKPAPPKPAPPKPAPPEGSAPKPPPPVEEPLGPTPPPPPPSEKQGDAPPPPPPLPGSVCQVCRGKLMVSARCGLCLTCRFKLSDPFSPTKELLCWGMLKPQATNTLTAQLTRLIDVRTGRLIANHMVEARCFRVDAPEWRYELVHSWPSALTLSVEDPPGRGRYERVLVKKPDEDCDAPPGPFNLSGWIVRAPYVASPQPLKVSASITCKKSEQWALGLVLVETSERAMHVEVMRMVEAAQAPLEERLRLDRARIYAWVNEHRPDRVSKKDMLRNVEPPVMKLVCCTSLSRIETAVRGVECDHLQCFDLGSYVHTMRTIPPKHAWCCPICDRPAPVHQLRLDAFAQSVLDATQPNVTEVLVADNGKWEISATEEPLEEGDSSEDDVPFPHVHRPPTQADLQQAALNLGRAFSAPGPAPQPRAPAAPAPAPARPRERSRSPRRPRGAGREAVGGQPADDAADKMHIWEKLQGIAKPEEPKSPSPEPEPEVPKEEDRFGWAPEGAVCSRCEKTVVDRGGVYCGRKRPDGSLGGCFKAICWKCMNKASKDDIGGIRSSKTEFASIGEDAWWMHEKCMTVEDKKAYFGEEDDDAIDKPKDMDDDSDDDHPGKFAWE